MPTRCAERSRPRWLSPAATGEARRSGTGYYVDYRPRPLRVVDSGQNLIAGRPYNSLLVTLFKAMGFAASEYQKFGRPGFGAYNGYNTSLAAHYAPFLAQPDEPLPFLYPA